MRPLGQQLAASHRVILIDRPVMAGATAPPTAAAARIDHQAERIAQTLDALGIAKAIVVAIRSAAASRSIWRWNIPTGWPARAGRGGDPSLAGRRGVVLHLEHHPTDRRRLRQNHRAAARHAAAPGRHCQRIRPNAPPPDYASRAAAGLLLRPKEFSANAADVVALYDAVQRQAPRYGALAMPVGIITGDSDTVVSPAIHSRTLAAVVPQSRLVILKRHRTHAASRGHRSGGPID